MRPDGFRRGHDSEYPAVVIPVAMLQRNLLYTGVTRGKRLVVLVGQKKAVAIAVRNVSGRRRWRSSASGWRWDIARRQGTHPSLESTSALGVLRKRIVIRLRPNRSRMTRNGRALLKTCAVQIVSSPARQ